MSTRCQIKSKESDIHIYKHCDGYPSNILPVLMPFVKRFHAKRGCEDTAYLLCQIVRAFAVDDYTGEPSIIREKGDNENFYYSGDYLGWGLDCVEHCDIEYLYEIDDNGIVYCNKEEVTDEYMKNLDIEL